MNKHVYKNCMKYSIIILSSFCIAFNAFSQASNAVTDQQKELYAQLKTYNYIETEYKGYQEADTSVVWQKAADLFEDLTVKEIVSICSDSSYTIKYYAFLKLLPVDDSLAFEKLNQWVNDSARILFWFNNAGGGKNFNQLLAGEYKKFIELKYHRGGIVTLADRHYLGENTYCFPKFNAAIWKRKYDQFTKLANLKGFNKTDTE